MMRVAILHFHLRAGGVTRVIELAAGALNALGVETLVISGDPPPPGCCLPPEGVAVVPELAYGREPREVENLLAHVAAACRRRWAAEADVLHIHNHSLGKNFALPLAVAAWAARGRPLLLQVHDFAENGRPANYRALREHLGGSGGLSRTLYPLSPRIAYGLLNSRDAGQLAAAGMTAHCEVIPNPVSLPEGGEPVARNFLGASKAIVYPTRAIRRKNIGEAVLWAALAPKGEKIILTSAPVSGPDATAHEEWKTFVGSLGLPVLFDAQGRFGRPAGDFLLGADLCLTTSMAEGFGMAFLEPFLAGRPLTGRDLPEITRDFRTAGLDLAGLYPRLDMPAAWFGPGELENRLEEGVQSACSAYGVPCHGEYLSRAWRSVRHGDKVDFGRLGEDLQRRVIAGLASGRFSASAFDPPRLEGAASCVAENGALIRERFSPRVHAERLLGLYRRLLAAPGGAADFLEARRVLESFLGFGNFCGL